MTRLERWGLLMARRRRRVLACAFLVVAVTAALAPLFTSRLHGVTYETPGSDSAQVNTLLHQRLGVTERDALVVTTARADALAPALRRVMRAAAAVPGVRRVLPPGAGDGARSPDGRAAVATILLRGDSGARLDAAQALQGAVARAAGPHARAQVTGPSPIFADLIDVEVTDLGSAETVGLPLALVILVLAFGTVVAAGLPIALAIAGIVSTFGILGLLGSLIDFNSFTENAIVMVGLAVGIDYALLIVGRFREERRQHDRDTAVGRTVATAGRTVIFSGATVAVSLLPLALVGVPIMTPFALGTLVVVAVMVTSALTALPATLAVLDHRLERLRVPRPRLLRATAPGAEGVFGRLARRVMRRPVLVLVPIAALLLLAGSATFGTRTGIDLGARAMQDKPSVRALTTLQQRFPGATLSPVQVAVATADARAAARIVRADRGFASVQVSTLGAGRALLLTPLRDPVDSRAGEASVRRLRASFADHGIPALVGGTTAESLDYSDQVLGVTAPIIAATLLLSFLLLLWVFRSPLLALKAVLANLLSIGAAFGLVVLVFQNGAGESVLGFSSTGYLQSWAPLTLFVLVFGLSMDYEVFLVTRIREEYDRVGDTEEAVARGLDHTGGVITSAAAIMVAVFAAFMLTRMPEIKQLGFGLAVAVLIDATLVRLLLVPAFMRIAGRWNWWMPAPLGRLLPRAPVHDP